jgi:hypothetical protein
MADKGDRTNMKDILDQPVCHHCIGDRELIQRIKSESSRAHCAYCGRIATCVPLSKLGDIVHEAFSRFYEPGGDVPDFESQGENIDYLQE